MGKNYRRVTNISCASFTAMTGKGLTTRRIGPVVARRTNTKLRMRPMSPPKKRKKDGSKKESEDEHNAMQETNWMVGGRMVTEVDIEEVEADIVINKEQASRSETSTHHVDCKDEVDDDSTIDDDVDVGTPSKKRKDQEIEDITTKWKERATRAERQLKTITKTRVINTYAAGEVKQYAKQVLWKKVKFITSDGTMVRCMKDAANAFSVPEEEQQDWMSTYSHTVREAVNAQRNHCCQELRKALHSKLTDDDHHTIISL